MKSISIPASSIPRVSASPRGWCRLAGRVVVEEDDAGGVAEDGGFEDLARGHVQEVDRADGDLDDADQAVQRIQVDDHEMLAVGIADIVAGYLDRCAGGLASLPVQDRSHRGRA
jgi:hypothetical protein